MNNGSSSRVLIPKSARKTIQDIKEVASKHSDEDVYAMLQECNMDPNETAQKLLYLDSFQEVKKKRDGRKLNVNNRVSEESRWRTGTQGRGFRGGREYYSSSHISHGGGRYVTAQKENGVSNRMERGLNSPATVPEKTENNTNPPVTTSKVSVNGPQTISNGTSGNKCVPQPCAGVYSSTSDPLMVPPLNSQNPVDGAIKRQLTSQTIASESGASHPAVNGSSTAHNVPNNVQATLGDVTFSEEVLKQSPVVEENQHLEPSQPSFTKTSYGSLDVVSIQNGNSSPQLIGPSEVVASEAATLAVEAGSQSLPEPKVSVLEDATSKLDTKLEKLNISADQVVIFPRHLKVPEDIMNGLTFGSLDFEESVNCGNKSDEWKDSLPAPELLQENGKAAKETSTSNLSLSSAAREGNYQDNPHSPPHLADNVPHLKENVSSGAAPKDDHTKHETMLSQGGPQYPFVHIGPNYGFPFIPPMLGSQFVQREGPEPQSGNSLVSSTPVSTQTATQPAGVGQNSVLVSPPQFPFFRQLYPPNYYPYGPYFPSFYLAPNGQQLLGQSGLPQQPSTGNLYLLPPPPSPAAAAAAVPGTKGKPGINAGNLTQFGVPSGYKSNSPSPAVTTGNSDGNEDIAASGLKENSVYSTAQQGDGLLLWLPAPGRDVLHANSFYNHHLPQGVALSPSPPGVYHHPPQTMATTTSTAHPLS